MSGLRGAELCEKQTHLAVSGHARHAYVVSKIILHADEKKFVALGLHTELPGGPVDVLL